MERNTTTNSHLNLADGSHAQGGYLRRSCLGATLLLAMCMTAATEQQDSYRYYSIGDPTAAVTLAEQRPEPSLVLMGGGPEVDQAFRWMIGTAGVKPGSGGRFVILRAIGSGACNAYIY